MAEILSIKKQIACVLCKMIPINPVTLPCECYICNKHLSDHFVKTRKIRCPDCKEEFEVSNQIDFRVANKKVKNILNEELYLNEHERSAKKSFNFAIDQFKQKYEILIDEAKSYESENYDHFAELRRQIDIQKEELIRDTTKKIEEVWLILIQKTKDTQMAFNQKLKDLNIVQIDLDKERELINDEFRKLDLSIERIEALNSAQIKQIKAIESKLKDVEKLKQQIKSYSFNAAEFNFTLSSFGIIKINYLKNKLISCSHDDSIKVWDFENNQCTKTLNGHADSVLSIEYVSVNKVLSASFDRTIKLWDLDNGLCVRTFYGHMVLVFCLKMLNEHSFAGGSHQEIIIWDLADGRIIKKLKGHVDAVSSLIFSNGNLISCSMDKTIKIWNVEFETCSNTLIGHSGAVEQIILLEDGNIASGSYDNSIKIWNHVAGNCIITLKGHTNSVRSLCQTNSEEIISGSADKTIKIWNLNTGICIKTLFGHVSWINDLKSFELNKLISCSSDKTIRFWNLETGQCIKTLIAHTEMVDKIILI